MKYPDIFIEESYELYSAMKPYYKEKKYKYSFENFLAYRWDFTFKNNKQYF